MQTVSQGWIDNQAEVMTSKAYLELSMFLTDDDWTSAGDLTDNGHLDMSDTYKTRGDSIYGDVLVQPYATLEHNFWTLDGTKNIVPTSSPYGYNAYVGDEISDADGLFTTDPLITLEFLSTITDTREGITITWSNTYGEYPSDYTIIVYDGVSVVDTFVIADNDKIVNTVQLGVSDYDKITIEINKWAFPYHRARMDKLYLGLKTVYTNADIKGYTTKRRCDPYCFEAPTGELAFSVDNSLGQFDPLDADSLFQYLSKDQKVTVRVGYKIDNLMEWINNGTFYLTDWKNLTSVDRADFIAGDFITISNATYYKGKYTTSTTTTLKSMAHAVFADMGVYDSPLVSNPSYEIDDRLDSISFSVLYPTLPIMKHKECLQLIANSAGCCMYMDKDNVWQIKDSPYSVPTKPTVQDFSISRLVQYEKSDLKLSMYKDSNYARNYYYEIASSATTVATKQIKIPGDDFYRTYIVLHDSPTNAVSTDTTINTTIISGSGWSKIVSAYYSNATALLYKSSSACTVEVEILGKVLTPKSYQEIVGVEEQQADNVIYIDNAITYDTQQYDIQVALGEYLSSADRRKIYTPNFRLDPRLDIADYISIENPNDTDTIFLNELNVSFNGTFKAIGEGRTI